MLVIKKEISIEDFEPWSGAVDWYEWYMNCEDDIHQFINEYIEDVFIDGCTETESNDFFWFELYDVLTEYGMIDE